MFYRNEKLKNLESEFEVLCKKTKNSTLNLKLFRTVALVIENFSAINKFLSNCKDESMEKNSEKTNTI